MIPLLLAWGCSGPGPKPADPADSGDPGSSATRGVSTVDADADHVPAPADCDDADPTVHPGADEVCNGRDDDCDGDVDAGAVDADTWYADGDADGYGAGDGVRTCIQPAGHTLWSGDCDDGDPDVHPGAAEWCDGVDTNCTDGEADAQDAAWWYRDLDGDGYGRAATLDCVVPEGYLATSGDCDDADPTVSPGADEVCGGGDEDCDGLTDEAGASDAAELHADLDGDGYGAPDVAAIRCPTAGWVVDATDCDDAEREAHPGADEVCGGGDEDCDGEVDEETAVDAPAWYRDADGDGFGDPGDVWVTCAAGGGWVPRAGDCDDTEAGVNPNAVEDCAVPEDLNCDGSVGGEDGDGDGTAACDDCDDTDPSRAGSVTWFADADWDTYGNPADSEVSCFGRPGDVFDATDCDDADPAAHPGATEVWYDGVDQACDGDSDWDADGDGHDVEDIGGDCDDTNAAVSPDAVEVCGNHVDDDCSGDRSDCGFADEVAANEADIVEYGPGWDDGLGYSLAGPILAPDGAVGVAVGAVDGARSTREDSGAGRVYLVSLDSTNGVGGAWATWVGEVEDDLAGSALAAVGDQTGDGVDDLVIGAAGESSVSELSGALYLVDGALAGEQSLADATLKATGLSEGVYLGVHLAALGDTDGDGRDDWAASTQTRANEFTGSVHIFTSGPVGTMSVEDADAVVIGENVGDAVGMYGLAGPGDLDGDGYADLMATTYARNEVGTACVMLGPLRGRYTFAAADACVEGDTSQGFGLFVAEVGDLDGDGYPDVAVAASGADADARGAVHLFSGLPLDGAGTGAAYATIQGDETHPELGYFLASAGDVDGDGPVDLLVGHLWEEGDPGLYLMYGPFQGTTDVADAPLTDIVSEDQQDGSIRAAVALGDPNADGYADFVFGDWYVGEGESETGAYYVFYGRGP